MTINEDGEEVCETCNEYICESCGGCFESKCAGDPDGGKCECDPEDWLDYY